ncbi:HlyD family efflux transporter periplasmic adaptor subunit [Nostoc sp. NIES-2111]
MNTLRRQENDFWQQSNQPIPQELPILEANEFLPHIGKWTSIGGVIVFSIFVAGVVLASILKYNATVKVPATIRPVGELKLVQSLISGKIIKVDVAENQLVVEGQAIAYIDNSRLQTQKSQLQNVIQQSQLQLSNIDTQLKEIDTQITAQTNLNDRTVIAAQAELSGTQRNYVDQQVKAAAQMTQAQSALTLARIQKDRLQREKLLTATVQETEAALNLARAQSDRLQRENLLKTTIQEAETAWTLAKAQRDRLQQDNVLTATIQEAQAALTLAQVQRDRLRPIVASGAIARNFIEEKEQAVISAQAKLAQAKVNAKNLVDEKEQGVISALAKLEQAKANTKNLLEEKDQAVISAQAKLEQAKANAKNLLEEKDQAVIVAQTNLEKARTEINPSNANVTVASQRIKQEQAKGEATLAALKKEKETLLQQRLEFQKQFDRTRKDLQQTENDLNQSVIRAPIAGTVLQLNLRNSGQVVQPSEAIAQIAPINAPIQIKANVPAQDISKIKPGQQVQMQVSACPYPDYGTLKGIVKTIAPDALPIASNNQQATVKATAYEVIVEPKTPYVGRGNRQCQLKAGMEGKANIISRQETVLRFILRKARLIADL